MALCQQMKRTSQLAEATVHLARALSQEAAPWWVYPPVARQHKRAAWESRQPSAEAAEVPCEDHTPRQEPEEQGVARVHLTQEEEGPRACAPQLSQHCLPCFSRRPP